MATSCPIKASPFKICFVIKKGRYAMLEVILTFLTKSCVSLPLTILQSWILTPPLFGRCTVQKLHRSTMINGGRDTQCTKSHANIFFSLNKKNIFVSSTWLVLFQQKALSVDLGLLYLVQPSCFVLFLK